VKSNSFSYTICEAKVVKKLTSRRIDVGTGEPWAPSLSSKRGSGPSLLH